MVKSEPIELDNDDQQNSSNGSLENYCLICDLQMPNVQDYLSHIDELHGIGNSLPLPIKIEVGELNESIEDTNDTDEMTEKCEICRETFSDVQAKNSHLKSTHKDLILAMAEVVKSPPKNAKIEPESKVSSLKKFINVTNVKRLLFTKIA